MKKKYVLSKMDLHFIFGTRVSQVKDGLNWYYQPNDNFPDKMSPKEAADLTDLPIERYEEAFQKRFGKVEPEIVDNRLSGAKKEAILKRYPGARIVSFKEKHGHSKMWFLFDKYKKKLCEPSMTSFGDNVIRPRWFSALSDILCVFTLGLIKPKRKPGEKCFGDLPEINP